MDSRKLSSSFSHFPLITFKLLKIVDSDGYGFAEIAEKKNFCLRARYAPEYSPHNAPRAQKISGKGSVYL
jgi:hypothetical protein